MNNNKIRNINVLHTATKNWRCRLFFSLENYSWNIFWANKVKSNSKKNPLNWFFHISFYFYICICSVRLSFYSQISQLPNPHPRHHWMFWIRHWANQARQNNPFRRLSPNILLQPKRNSSMVTHSKNAPQPQSQPFGNASQLGNFQKNFFFHFTNSLFSISNSFCAFFSCKAKFRNVNKGNKITLVWETQIHNHVNDGKTNNDNNN